MKSYVAEMRKYIGHAPLLLVAVGVVVHDGERILLQRRRDNGKWAIHGGALELGENIDEALSREVYEELGINLGKKDLYGIFSGTSMHHVYPNGDEVHCVNIVYSCSEFSGTPTANTDEVTALQWFNFGNLPSDLSEPIDREILKELELKLKSTRTEA